MRGSTLITFVVLAAIATLGPGLIIFRIPLVPNWPYVGLICMGASVLVIGVCAIFARGNLRRPTPISKAWLLRVFPLWFAGVSFFWSYARAISEEFPCLDFAQGRVVAKYRSSNHNYLSVAVEVKGRGTLACEGISLASWNAVSTDSMGAKQCGSSDITVLTP